MNDLAELPNTEWPESFLRPGRNRGGFAGLGQGIPLFGLPGTVISNYWAGSFDLTLDPHGLLKKF
jgi:hypothetical protein